MNDYSMQTYVDEIEAEARRLGEEGQTFTELTPIVDQFLKKVTASSEPDTLDLEAFALGEKAFYQEQYDLALKHYLSARKVPDFRFFCYRTSAYASYQLGRFEKALEFVNKALKMKENDYFCLRLLNHLENRRAESGEFSPLDAPVKNLEELSSFFKEETLEEAQKEYLSAEDLTSDQTVEHPFESNIFNHGIVHHQAPNWSESIEEFSTEGEESLKEPLKEPLAEPAADRAAALSPEKIVHFNTRIQQMETDTEASNQLKAQDLSSEQLELTSNSHQEESLSQEKEMLDLQQIAESGFFQKTATTQYIQDRLGLELDTSQTLQQRITSFQEEQNQLLSEYVAAAKKRSKETENFLTVLSGWNYQASKGQEKTSRYLLSESERKTSGGYFFRWQGKGIAINPGTHFLENFHRQGLHIQDIDYVIVSQDAQDTYADVKAIYDLNYQLNQTTPHLHIIHYYLDQQAHKALSPLLKPNFKQERNTIHCLELYVDSPDMEKIELNETINLFYFPTAMMEGSSSSSAADERSFKRRSSLGIRLDLATEDGSSLAAVEGRSVLKLGYISGTAWTPMLSQHLGQCDLLLTGFETTSASDYGKVKYLEDCLGYFGTCSLIEEVRPQLLIYSEFSGREGDLRIEIAKKMRQEEAFGQQNTVVLPGDTGLYVDLTALKVQCSVSQQLVEPRQVRVTKVDDAFGPLKYLAPSCII